MEVVVMCQNHEIFCLKMYDSRGTGWAIGEAELTFYIYYRGGYVGAETLLCRYCPRPPKPVAVGIVEWVGVF